MGYGTVDSQSGAVAQRRFDAGGEQRQQQLCATTGAVPQPWPVGYCLAAATAHGALMARVQQQLSSSCTAASQHDLHTPAHRAGGVTVWLGRWAACCLRLPLCQLGLSVYVVVGIGQPCWGAGNTMWGV